MSLLPGMHEIKELVEGQSVELTERLDAMIGLLTEIRDALENRKTEAAA